MITGKHSILGCLLICLSALTVVTQGCSRQVTEKVRFGAIERKLLLEVRTESSETVYPRGKTVEIRLFDNREVEFDFYKPNTPDRVGSPFVAEIRVGLLETEVFAKILDVLNQPDLANAQSHFSPTRRGLDAWVKKTVTIEMGTGQKQILLEENDSHLHLGEKDGSYPKPLIRLLELTEIINRDLRRQIDPESR